MRCKKGEYVALKSKFVPVIRDNLNEETDFTPVWVENDILIIEAETLAEAIAEAHMRVSLSRGQEMKVVAYNPKQHGGRRPR